MGTTADRVIPTVAAIPTVGACDLLWSLIVHLVEDAHVDEVLVLDNGMAPDVRDLLNVVASHHATLRVIDAAGERIYAMWDEAASDVEHNWGTPANLALLNDDIRLPRGAVSTLASWLRSVDDVALVSPDYHRTLDQPGPQSLRRVTGTYRHHGIAGWCFVVRAELWPGIDERFRWWCGDDDLAFGLEAAGHGLAIVDGLPCEHLVEATASLPEYSWTHESREADLRLCAEKWGR